MAASLVCSIHPNGTQPIHTYLRHHYGLAAYCLHVGEVIYA